MTAAERLKAVRLLVARVRSRYGPRADSERDKPAHAAAGAAPAHNGDHAPHPAPEHAHADETLRELIRSVLVWEATTTLAELALRRVERAVVDFNDLRVCMAEEMERIIGVTYPRVDERVRTLRAVLGEVYARQHAVTLAHLDSASRRAAGDYLRSLPGLPGFVADRVCLLRFDHPVMPIDSRILERMVKGRTVAADTTAKDAAALVEKCVKAADLVPTYLALQAWADEGPVPARRSSRPDPLDAIFRSRSVLVARVQTMPAPPAAVPAMASNHNSGARAAAVAQEPAPQAAHARSKSSNAAKPDRRNSKPAASRSAKPKRR